MGGTIFLIYRGVRNRRRERRRVRTAEATAQGSSTNGLLGTKDNTMLSGLLKAEAERSGESITSPIQSGSLLAQYESVRQKRDPLVRLSLYDVEKITAANDAGNDEVPLSKVIEKRRTSSRTRSKIDPDSIPLSMIQNNGVADDADDEEDNKPLSQKIKRHSPRKSADGQEEDDVPLAFLKK